MEQATLNFNCKIKPQPEELFKPDTQNFRLYRELLSGGITNVDISNLYILSHTRRISDIREALKPYCLDVKKERISGGIYFYKLTG
jgi:hypothetical protein